MCSYLGGIYLCVFNGTDSIFTGKRGGGAAFYDLRSDHDAGGQRKTQSHQTCEERKGQVDVSCCSLLDFFQCVKLLLYI